MKRVKIISATALALLLLVPVLAMLHQTSGTAPTFVPGTTASFSSLTIGYSYPYAPAAGGMVWVKGVRRGGGIENPVLYDIDKRVVVGELLNAEPVLLNQDQTKLLCRQTSASLKGKLGAFLNQVSGNRIELQWPYQNVVTFWMLDLRRDSATRVGQYTGWWRTENKEFTPSPGFHFGFTEHDDGGDFLLCDLKKDRLTSIKAAGDALGWWDDHNVLMRNAASDLMLFDVVTRKTNTLFSVITIAQSLREFGLTNDAARLTFFPNWNGHDYDFYFTVGSVDWLKNAKSFLIKVDHAGPSLRLLYRNYSTLLCGVLDAGATHCLYVRIQSATNASEGIILRDLRDNTEVAIDQSRIGSYSISHFYREGVLFCSHDELWLADLNGSNHIRLIPPPP
jgi:hypothetical protein